MITPPTTRSATDSDLSGVIVAGGCQRTFASASGLAYGGIASAPLDTEV